MKLIVALLLTALISFVAGLYLPWWSIAPAAFIAALLIHQRPGRAFLAGFLGVFLLWAALAWWIDMKNEHYLSHKVAQLLPLGGNSFLLIAVSALLGGLVAGFAALSGSFLRSSPRR